MVITSKISFNFVLSYDPGIYYLSNPIFDRELVSQVLAYIVGRQDVLSKDILCFKESGVPGFRLKFCQKTRKFLIDLEILISSKSTHLEFFFFEKTLTESQCVHSP